MKAVQRDAPEQSRAARRQTQEGARAAGSPSRDAASSSREASSSLHDTESPQRERASSSDSRRALRESRRGGESFETSILPSQGAAQSEGGGVLARAAAEAAAREREMRQRGVAMPRRVLLTVSDPARMAQINLLLRSASYEVRAAFDGGQALDLLRIERADVLVLDYDLKLLNGIEVLRRLGERHGGRPPLPVLLLCPASAGEAVRDEASRLGAMGFVQLPYDPAELLVTARETGSKG